MTGYYKIEATDAFGCQSKYSVLVVVHPLPLVTITGPASYCAGDTIQLLGQGAMNYSWSLPDGSSIPTDSITILNSLASNSGTVILFGTDSNQCSNTDSLAIIVTPYPNAQVNNIGSICPGASFTLLGGGEPISFGLGQMVFLRQYQTQRLQMLAKSMLVSTR